MLMDESVSTFRVIVLMHILSGGGRGQGLLAKSEGSVNIFCLQVFLC